MAAGCFLKINQMEDSRKLEANNVVPHCVRYSPVPVREMRAAAVRVFIFSFRLFANDHSVGLSEEPLGGRAS